MVASLYSFNDLKLIFNGPKSIKEKPGFQKEIYHDYINKNNILFSNLILQNSNTVILILQWAST